jgi:hypothetical protein
MWGQDLCSRAKLVDRDDRDVHWQHESDGPEGAQAPAAAAVKIGEASSVEEQQSPSAMERTPNLGETRHHPAQAAGK